MLTTILTKKPSEQKPSNRAFSVDFDRPVIVIEELKTSYDAAIVSNSFVRAVGSYLKARIIQQIHHYLRTLEGFFYDGKKWIFKSIRAMIYEALVGFTVWQVRVALQELCDEGILNSDFLWKYMCGDNYNKYNRTKFYAIDYDILSLTIAKAKSLETIENNRFVSTAKEFCEESPNNNENTSKEKNQRLNTLPYPSSNSSNKKQERENDFSTNEKLRDRPSSRPSNQSSNIPLPLTDEEFNESKSEEFFSQPDPKTVETSSKAVNPRKKKCSAPVVRNTKAKLQTKVRPPWRSQQEKNEFQLQLTEALAQEGIADSPAAMAAAAIKKFEQGNLTAYATYWKKFKNGQPLCSKNQWEKTPNSPYNIFFNYIAEKLRLPADTDVSAVSRAGKEFKYNKLAIEKNWANFITSCELQIKRVEAVKKNGITNLAFPKWLCQGANLTGSELDEFVEVLSLHSKVGLSIAGSEKPNTALDEAQADLSLVNKKVSLSSAIALEIEPESLSTLPKSEIGVSVPEPQLSPAPASIIDDTEVKRTEESKGLEVYDDSDFFRPVSKKPKFSCMTLAEINEELSDPISAENIRPWIEELIDSGQLEGDRDNDGKLIQVSDPEQTDF